MSAAKHTPGPWQFYSPAEQDKIQKEAWTYLPKGKTYRIAARTTMVGLLFKSHPNEPDPTRENICLMATAPELLADLQQATATLRCYEALHRAKGGVESNAKAEVDAALAARFEATIAKATMVTK